MNDLAFPIDGQDIAVELTVETVFDFGAAEYADLFRRSRASVFQSPFWLDAFYGRLAGKLGAEPVIVVARDVISRELIFVLPLVRQTQFGVTVLQPADIGVSDYNAIVGEPDRLEALSRSDAFRRQLKSAIEPYDLLLFRKQHPYSFDIAKLFDRPRVSDNENAAYALDFSMGYEEWSKTKLSASRRQGLSRKKRKLEREVGKADFRILKDPDEIREAFVFLRRVRTLRFPGDLFARDEYYDFYLDLAIAEAESGKAVTFACNMAGRFICADFCLVEGSRIYTIITGFEEADGFDKYSLGYLSLAAMFRECEELGMDVVDFTIGDEDYKTSLGCDRTPLHNVISANSLGGFAAMQVYTKGGMLKSLAKKVAPNLR
ncbi:MAG: GNAT family N-acetyltransferase [Hyphomicrobiales bacterium]|nr:GNAT family N-acetyltransferase [Hyphomicrobiales bacterium]